MIDINIKADKSLHLKLCPKRFEKNFKPVENIAHILHDHITNRASQLVLSVGVYTVCSVPYELLVDYLDLYEQIGFAVNDARV